MTNDFTTYRLTFTAPLHIGDYKPNEYGSSMDCVPSDTLIAALMAVRAQYGLSLPEGGNPGFTISSLFPFIRINDSAIHFFPKPISGLPVPKDTLSNVKKIKKVKWVDTPYLSKIITGNASGNYGGNDCNHIHGAFLSEELINVGTEEDTFSVYQRQVSQRVSLPRIWSDEEENRLFEMERLYFKDNTGLYFLFKGDKQSQQWLEESLDILKEEGIGTDRNVGHGSFTWKQSKLTLEVPDKTTYIMTLSMFHPEDQSTLSSMLSEHAVWKLTKRGGWITDPAYQTIRKRSVYMFAEGSVFRRPEGANNAIGLPAINLQPQENEYPVNHPIWRCGRSLVLPIKRI